MSEEKRCVELVYVLLSGLTNESRFFVGDGVDFEDEALEAFREDPYFHKIYRVFESCFTGMIKLRELIK